MSETKTFLCKVCFRPFDVTYEQAREMMDEGRLIIVHTGVGIDMVHAVCPRHLDEEFAARMARFKPEDWGLTWEEPSEGTESSTTS